MISISTLYLTFAYYKSKERGLRYLVRYAAHCQKHAKGGYSRGEASPRDVPGVCYPLSQAAYDGNSTAGIPAREDHHRCDPSKVIVADIAKKRI